MSRRLARELSMKVLFEMHMNDDFNLDKIKYHMEEDSVSNRQDDYIYDVLTKAKDNIGQIDSIIENYSKGWKLNRIANVDLAILRLAFAEVLYMDNIPFRVSINEAIELAKVYGSDESPSFINGILGNYVEKEGLKQD